MNQIMYNYFDADLVTIMVAYLFVSYGKSGAGFFAFAQGFLIDIFSPCLISTPIQNQDSKSAKKYI